MRSGGGLVSDLEGCLASRSSARQVARLLKRGVDVNTRLAEGGSFLALSLLANCDAATVELLLSSGAAVDSADDHGNTPLLCEVIKRETKDIRPAIVELLLSCGANANKQNNAGSTPLTLLCMRKKLLADTIEALLRNGATPNQPDGDGVYPLIYVVKRQCHDADSTDATTLICVVNSLLSHGADSNCADRAGATPLMWAAYMNDQVSAISSLLAGGSDPNRTDTSGRTALFYALEGVQTVENVLLTVGELVRAGARINVTDSSSSVCPLLLASREKYKNVFSFLVDHGADEQLPFALLKKGRNQQK